MSEPFLGQISLFPYSFPPKGWADCVGQLMPISQNTALFSLLGINYGGNGTTVFGLPDLQGRVAVGMGQLPGGGDYVQGDIGGNESVTIDSTTMPAHGHALNATQDAGTVNTPAGNVLATVFVGDLSGGNQGNVYNPETPDSTLEPASITQAGGTQPHSNLQPSLVLRYCIALTGVFPQRN